MRRVHSPRSLRGRLRPLWPLPVIIGVIALTIILVARERDPRGAADPEATSGAARQKSGYENRAVLRQEGEAQAPAKTVKITGTVYDIEGHKIPGVRVGATTFEVAGNQSTTAATAESDAQGRFELAVREGAYYLSGEKAGYAPLLTLAHSGDEVGVVLRKSGAVTGHVYNDKNEPVTRFSIDVIAPTGDDMAAPAPFTTKTFESPDGSYRIEGVPGGGVLLRATSPEYAPTVSAMVNVAEDKTETVDLTLPRGCVVTGVVEDEEGAPLADVFVDAELRRSASALGTSSIDAVSQAETDASGRFRLERVAVGDVAIRAYDGDHAVSSVETNIPSCDAVQPVKIRMTAGSALSGVIKDSEGKPVGGARLTLSHRAVGFVSAMSDAEGRYRFDRLPAGGMRLEARRDARRAVVMVSVPEGAATSKDITFPATGTGEVRGRITAGGQPLSGMQLMIVANAGEGVMDMRYPVTDKDGAYRVAELKEGLYVVLLPSTSQISSAQVGAGEVKTVDIDVAEKPKPSSLPPGTKAGGAAQQKGGDRKGGDEAPPQEDDAQ